ncbi:MAG: hypothetical protein DME75_07840 [Verrucomicrobia bacterium]|nr:MAG: hypothetical protein DME75_07840 [Verrucomicrobiota bacterium]
MKTKMTLLLLRNSVNHFSFVMRLGFKLAGFERSNAGIQALMRGNWPFRTKLRPQIGLRPAYSQAKAG